MLTRNEWEYLIGGLSFFTALFILWFIYQRQAKKRIERQRMAQEQLKKQFNDLVNRKSSAAELMARSSTQGLDLPYTICYFNDPADPTRWISNPSPITANTTIVRLTRAFPIPAGDTCTGTSSPQFDLRTTASTLNEGFNDKVDNILKLFMEQLYPGIAIQSDTIIKNLSYAPTTQIYQLSVAAVYRTTQNSFDLLINQYRVDAAGTLVNNPPQSLNGIQGTFGQFVRQGVITVRNRVDRYFLVNAKSATNATITVRLLTKAEILIGTITVNPSTFSYAFIAVPSEETKIYLDQFDNPFHSTSSFAMFTFPLVDTPTKQTGSQSDFFVLQTRPVTVLPPAPAPPPGAPTWWVGTDPMSKWGSWVYKVGQQQEDKQWCCLGPQNYGGSWDGQTLKCDPTWCQYFQWGNSGTNDKLFLSGVTPTLYVNGNLTFGSNATINQTGMDLRWRTVDYPYQIITSNQLCLERQDNGLIRLGDCNDTTKRARQTWGTW